MNVPLFILVGSILLFTGVMASRLASRFGVPALLLFLVIGMVAGSEGVGGIPFDDPVVAMLVGFTALGLILFDGGLRTDVQKMDRSIVRSGVLLATLGVVITAAVVGVVAVVALGVPLERGLLIGAILSSTDAAAVFAVLRARGVGVPQRLRSLIEFESASNDPTAVFLTATMIAVIAGAAGHLAALPVLYVVRLVAGGAIGWLAGWLLLRMINRAELEHEGLYPALTLAVVGITFGVAELLSTSGFMAVYVAGLMLAGKVFVHRASLMRFHDGAAWLMQIAMFLILGLLAFPSQLLEQAQPALLMSAVLVFLARPLAVFISLAFSGLTIKDRIFVSWIGLRGAAPIILATLPLVAGVEGSAQIFSIVFFAVVISVLVQGPTLGLVAKLLGIAEPERVRQRSPLEIDAAQMPGVELLRLIVQPASEADGVKLMNIGGPERPLVAMVRRSGKVFVPTGSTTLVAGDELFLLGDAGMFRSISASVCAPTATDDCT